jgi:hypothetical protein
MFISKRRARTMRVRDLNGYRVIYMPEHPAAMSSDNWEGFVYEHIVVAEKGLKRRLLSEEVCHHLDGNRKNNRSSNIIVLLRSQHTKLHTWLKGAAASERSSMKRVNSGKPREGTNRTCSHCGRSLQGKQLKYCSRRCERTARPSSCPPKTQLKEDIKNMSWCAMGRKYGVTDNAVRKWARKYDLLRQS